MDDEIYTKRISTSKSERLVSNADRIQRKDAEAEAQEEEVIQAQEKVLNRMHGDMLECLSVNLAYQLGQQGKRDQAKALAERAAKGAAKVLDAKNDPYTVSGRKIEEQLAKWLCDHDHSG